MDKRKVRAAAQRNFATAHKRGQRAQLRARLAGQTTRLIPFEAVRAALRQQNAFYAGVQQVPLAQVIGSVGRYQDFTREFLPLTSAMGERWVRVEALTQQRGWPPAEFYRVGDGYFVRDGNHRVAIAKQLGLETIEAHVWAYPETVNITSADSLNEILLRLGEARFLEQTGLDKRFPNHGIRFTVAGRYSYLLTQIHQLQQNLALIDADELEDGAEFPYDEAVTFWYESVYLPAVDIIRESAVMANFPQRTEADLYVWFLRYQEQLRERYNQTYLAELMQQAVAAGQPSAVGKLVSGVLGLFGRSIEPLDLS